MYTINNYKGGERNKNKHRMLRQAKIDNSRKPLLLQGGVNKKISNVTRIQSQGFLEETKTSVGICLTGAKTVSKDGLVGAGIMEKM